MSETFQSARQQGIFWLAAFVVFCVVLWLLEGMLLPFVLGLGIAYLLNPLVDWFGRKGYPRGVVALGLLVFFFGFVAALIVVVGPIVYHQTLQLARDIPDLVQTLWASLRPYTDWIAQELDTAEAQDIPALVQENFGSAVNVARNVLGGVAAGGQALLGALTLLFLMPIVAYFMLKEWPVIQNWVVDIMPRHHKETIVDLLGQINAKIAGFIRGQLAVMAAVGLMYAVVLSIAGLNYGILIGLLAGALTIIPLLGSFTGLLTSVAVAWFQSGEVGYVLIIASIFLIGQLVEGNLITPRLVGKYVGLHPLWVLFVLLAGASLFGFVGMLLAVPVAASAGVVIHFLIRRYKDSPLYTGTSAPHEMSGSGKGRGDAKR